MGVVWDCYYGLFLYDLMERFYLFGFCSEMALHSSYPYSVNAFFMGQSIENCLSCIVLKHMRVHLRTHLRRRIDIPPYQVLYAGEIFKEFPTSHHKSHGIQIFIIS